MKENKVIELQSLSSQQPSGHQIEVESPRQSLATKIRNKTKKQKKYKAAIKIPRSKLTILQG